MKAVPWARLRARAKSASVDPRRIMSLRQEMGGEGGVHELAASRGVRSSKKGAFVCEGGVEIRVPSHVASHVSAMTYAPVGYIILVMSMGSKTSPRTILR